MRPSNVMASGFLLAALCGVAGAQTAREGGGNAQVMQQLQQLGAERTQLHAENARLKGELEALRKERDQLKSGQQGSSARERAANAAVARSAQERESAAGELAQQKERMQELIAKFRETGQTLRDVESDRAAKTQSLATRERELEACTTRNRALLDLNEEILARYERQGFWSSLASKEPFTRLKRVELENLADGYRARAEDQRATSPAASGDTRPPGS